MGLESGVRYNEKRPKKYSLQFDRRVIGIFVFPCFEITNDANFWCSIIDREVCLPYFLHFACSCSLYVFLILIKKSLQITIVFVVLFDTHGVPNTRQNIQNKLIMVTGFKSVMCSRRVEIEKSR